MIVWLGVIETFSVCCSRRQQACVDRNAGASMWLDRLQHQHQFFANSCSEFQFEAIL